MIQTVKRNEQLRKEYHILPAALMDAFDEGEARGKSLGLAEGTHQAKLETARLMLQRNYPQAEICLMTGLTQEEVAGLN